MIQMQPASKFKTFLVISGLASLSVIIPYLLYGFYFAHWATYNTGFIEHILNPSFDKEFYTQALRANMGQVQTEFLHLSKTLLTVPLWFFISSAVTKILCFLALTGAAVSAGLKKREAAIFVFLLAVTASMAGDGSLLLPYNGFFDSPFYFRASLSFLLICFSVWALLAKRPLLAGFLMGLSFQFHLLNACATFAFLTIFVLVWAYENKNWKPALLFIGSAILFLIPWLNNSLGLDIPLISQKLWYDSIVARDADDVLTSYLAPRFLFFLIFPFPLFWLLPITERPPIITVIRKCIFVCLLLVSALCVVEVLHRSHLFFGKLSDLFVSVQLRRGLFVLYPLIAFGAFYVLLRARQRWPIYIWLSVAIALSCSALLTNYFCFFALLVLYFLLAQKLPKEERRAPYIALALYTFFLIQSFSYFGKRGGHMFSPFSYDISRQQALFFAIAALGVVLFSAFKRLQKSPTRAWLIIHTSLILFTIFIGVGSNRLKSHVRELSEWGWQKPLTSEALHELMYLNCHGKVVREMTVGDPDYRDVLRELKRLNTNRDVVLFPPRHNQCNTYVEISVFADSPAYIDENLDRGMMMFSREFASVYDQRLRDVFGRDRGLEFFYLSRDPTDIKDRFVKEYDLVDSKDVQKMFDEKKIRYFISRINHPKFRSVYQRGSIHIYESEHQSSPSN